MPEEPRPEFLRLFIALPVPLEVRAEIARAQGRLKRCLPSGVVRWTRAEQFHLTLKFLGDIHSTQIAALKKTVAEACGGLLPFALSAKGVGFFPNAQRPRVIWGGVEHDDTLTELHRRIHLAVLPFAPADTSERFAGHITLGRFRAGRRCVLTGLMESASSLRARSFGGWVAGQVELLRSELSATGARHELVATFPLE